MLQAGMRATQGREESILQEEWTRTQVKQKEEPIVKPHLPQVREATRATHGSCVVTE